MTRWIFPAPIEAGARVGTLEIARKGTPPVEIPLKATETVGLGGMAKRALGALWEITIGLVLVPAERS